MDTSVWDDEMEKAYDEFLAHPDKVTLCPKCHKPFKVITYPSSCVVTCGTPNCFRDICRGI